MPYGFGDSDQSGGGFFGRYTGERHMILKTPAGFKTANWAGPGTHVLDRLRDGNSEPLTVTDAISKAHDIDYSLATDLDKVRKADRRMLANLATAAKAGADSRLNLGLASAAIGLKVFAEDNLGVRKSLFIDPETTDNSPADHKLLAKERAKLTQQGYGFDAEGNPVLLPAQELKAQLLETFKPAKKEKVKRGPRGPYAKLGRKQTLAALTKIYRQRLVQEGAGFVEDVKKAVVASGEFIGQKLSAIELKDLIPVILHLLQRSAAAAAPLALAAL